MTSVVDNKKQLTVLGIDIGTTKLTVSSLTVDAGQPCKQEDLNPLVLSSDTGSKSIPPLIGFRGKMRHVGETAALEANSNAKNTLKDLVYFLGGDSSTLSATSANLYRQFKLEVDEATGKLQAVVEYNGKETKLGLELLVSMLVRTLEVVTVVAAASPQVSTSLAGIPSFRNATEPKPSVQHLSQSPTTR